MWGNSYISCLLLIIVLHFTYLVKYLSLKYHGHGCLQNFILLFMSLLTAPFVKNSHIFAGIYFIFRKQRARPNWKSSNTKFGSQWKDLKRSYKVRPILAFCCNYVAQILGWNCVKDLRVTKIVTKNRVWRGLERVRSKNLFLITIMDKIFLRRTLLFLLNNALREKLNLFLEDFC